MNAAHPTKNNARQRHETTGCNGAISTSLESIGERIMCAWRTGVAGESARLSRDERCASNEAPLMGYLGLRKMRRYHVGGAGALRIAPRASVDLSRARSAPQGSAR